MMENFPIWRYKRPHKSRKQRGSHQEEHKEAQCKTHIIKWQNLRQRENLKGSKGETGSNIQRRPDKTSSWLLNGNAPSQNGMARNIPSNEKQRPATETTLPRKALNYNRRPNKELDGQNKPQRIYLLQTSSARHTKGSALRIGRKTVREREEHSTKKWQWIKYLSLITFNVNGLNATIKRQR